MCANEVMRVLVACEESQAVCLAFREAGHEACVLMLAAAAGPEAVNAPDARGYTALHLAAEGRHDRWCPRRASNLPQPSTQSPCHLHAISTQSGGGAT